GMPWPPPTANTPAGKQKKDKRAEIKRMLRENRPDMGVYQIRNRTNGRIYVGSSHNLEGTRTSRLFQLRMGKVVFSGELQKELDEFGAEGFEFSVLGLLEKPEQSANVEQALAALELRWLEELRPFGERGYNSAKAFERMKNRLQMQGCAEPA
ncbi:MAG TPA: GIY-YIG nuclease family protein, partial [Geobacteraceae bacterium]